MSNKLLSFHGKQEIKDMYVTRVRAHQLADEIVQGRYWQNGKGCAVGCTIHGDDHSAYERELGIPRIIARLEDRIFEGLDNDNAKSFPLRFIEAIPVGIDLQSVWRKFIIWLLVDENEGVIRHAKTDVSKKAIQDVADLITRSLTEQISLEQFWQVRKAAYAAAADAAAAAAYAAADAADDAAAAAADAYAAADAADDAADDAAAAAADAAAAAAYAAAAYAADAAADAAARGKARQRKYSVMADKLIELLIAAA